MLLEWLNSALSPVVYGDIVPSIKIHKFDPYRGVGGLAF